MVLLLLAIAGFDCRQVVEGSMPSLVTVRAGNQMGSGFYVESQTVVTCAHVVRHSRTVTLESQSGRRSAGQVIRVDRRLDLAAIRTSLKGVPLSIGDSDSLSTGDRVLALGSPLGLSGTASLGIVSSRPRKIHAIDPPAIQTDAAIDSGNSGGPLLSSRGEVIGVVHGVRGRHGFAVPASSLLKFLGQPRLAPVAPALPFAWK